MSDYNSKKSSNNVFSLNKADGYLPPQQPELEEIILGSLLIDNSVIDKIMVEFTTNLFFVERNKFIAEAIIGLYKKNSPIDLVTMVTELKLNGKLQAVGGPAFISSLTSRVAKNISGVNQEIFVPASQKQQFSGENQILIDDRVDNIEQWKSKGGIGILHTSASDTIKQLKELGL